MFKKAPVSHYQSHVYVLTLEILAKSIHGSRYWARYAYDAPRENAYLYQGRTQKLSNDVVKSTHQHAKFVEKDVQGLT